MIFHKYIPDAPLNNYVDCIVYVEGNNKGVTFPKTAMSLAFNLNTSFKLFDDAQFLRFTDYKKYWVAGLQTKPTYVENYGESKMIVIQFRTFGARIFLNQPLKYFTNNFTELDCVFGGEVEEIWDQLAETKTINEKFQITEKFLYRKFSTNIIPNKTLIPSLERLCSGNVSINVVCKHHNISRKHLNFLFQEHLGVSPKMLSSLNRFQNMIQMISKSRADNLTTLAYELDFFDQAHFNNNFKKFTGIKPNDYIKSVEKKPSLKIVPHFLPAG